MKKNKVLKSVLSTTFYVFFILVLTYIIVNYGFRRTVVNGVSMETTLLNGDNIIMDKFTYNVSDVKRYDIICFKSYREKDLLIKRVIGLPGETVSYKDGAVYINDKELKGAMKYSEIENPGLLLKGITLNEDEYFVIGDNRAESVDSRFADVGNVKKDEILGRAAFIIYPFERIRIIK